MLSKRFCSGSTAASLSASKPSGPISDRRNEGFRSENIFLSAVEEQCLGKLKARGHEAGFDTRFATNESGVCEGRPPGQTEMCLMSQCLRELGLCRIKIPEGMLSWVDPANGDWMTHLAQALQLYLCHHKARLRLWFVMAHSTAFIGMLMLIKRYGGVFDFLCAAVPVKFFGSLLEGGV